MIKINTTILDLGDIFTHLSQAVTLSLYENLAKSHESFIAAKDQLIENTFEFDENVEIVALIDKQLDILDKNLRVLKIALEAHDAKQSEKRKDLKDLQMFWLN